MNRTYFIARVKAALFGGRISATQIDGLIRILDYLDKYAPRVTDAQLANYLATVKHETAHTMQPVKEYGGNAYFKRMYDIEGERPYKARELGNLKPGDGAKFPGMGLVQSTGRANARRARKIIRDLTGEDVDFESNPSLLMDWRYALPLMFEGFRLGIWTGKKISQYTRPDGSVDFVGARAIINGSDKAELIAGYGRAFETALKKAREKQDSPAPASAPAPVEAPQGQTTAPVIVDPEPPPVVGKPEDQATGKSALKSSTNIAATVGAIAGVATPASQAVTQITETINTGKSFSDAVVAAGPWVLLILVIAGVAGWIIYQRYLKSKNEGV